MSVLQTRHSTPRLSEVARHVIYPEGIVSTGYPAVERQLADMSIRLDPWQEGAGRIILGKRADGKYAATVGGVTLSIPRQVGKTFLIGCIVIALCIIHPGLTVVWTAHHNRTLSKTFQSMQGLVRRKKIYPHVRAIRTANGEQEIRFTNGSVIMFGAREFGFGRGFDQVDVEVFDEGQILTEKALEDMIPAANQSKHPAGALVLFMGTPPRPIDPGEVFTAKRTKAIAGEAPNSVYIEFSADENADPDDQEQWEKANPSFPDRTPIESMLRMREQLTSDDAFLREGLGVWDPVASLGVIPMQLFAEGADPESAPADRFALGVECGPELAYATVCLAGQRADGAWHFEIDEDQYTKGRGSDWVEPHIEFLVKNNPQIRAVAVDVGGPIKALLEEHAGGWRFKRSRVPVEAVRVSELGAATTAFMNGIIMGGLHHIPLPQLTSAASIVGKRPLGDTGMWVFSRKTATSDITQIQAANLALWAAQKTRTKKPSGRRTGRRAVVL